MQAQYHINMTQAALGRHFTAEALAEIVAANVGQDSLWSVLGAEPHRHFCDPVLARSLAYIEEEHLLIGELAQRGEAEVQQRAAFGRLLHTVQDFYAHSNYVDLWLAGEVFQEPTGLPPSGISHPQLRIGDWVWWRDMVFYVPVIGPLVRHYWAPANSHETMNLDSPARGPRFGWAVALARQRTKQEYGRVARTIRALGGRAALARFHGSSVILESGS
jgi:hypothetical protein